MSAETTWLDRSIWLTLTVIALSLATQAGATLMRAASLYTVTIRPVEPCRLVRVDDAAMSHNPFAEGR
jgi:hypothetical protein